MSYNKRTWANGNVVGAVDLNRMEQGIEDASGDSGFSCTETKTLLTEESVTAEQIRPGGVQGSFTNLESVTADLLCVTFNGTEYICEKRNPKESINEYGATYDMSTDTFDWSVYPFSIISLPLGTNLVTENAGTYAIKVEAVSQSVETTPCFDAAVKHALPNSSAMILEGGNSSSDRLNYTFAEIKEAIVSGRSIIFHYVPSIMTELSEFYTQDVEVRFNNSTRYVSVMFRELEQYVVYAAQSDDDYPAVLS